MGEVFSLDIPVYRTRQILTSFRFLLGLLQMTLSLSVVRMGDAAFWTLAVHFRMQIRSAVRSGLLCFGNEPVGFGPGIPTNSGSLPGNFQFRRAATDFEAIAFDRSGDEQVGRPFADRS